VKRHRWLVLSVLALVGVLVLGAFPARAYLDQLHQRHQLADRVQALAHGNSLLAEQVRHLQTDEAVERLARQRYHLVRPGEEAYAILPDGRSHGRPDERLPEASTALTPSTTASPAEGWWSRAWARITSIF
jgi:cell division protein FtsB